MSDLFPLTEAQVARLVPLLLSDTRGVLHVDDHRVISTIVRVLRSGCRWVDAPPCDVPRKTLYNRFVLWTAKGVSERVFHARGSRRAAGRAAARQLDDEGAPQRRGRKRGERAQAIGVSRGGRTTKLHAARTTSRAGRAPSF